MSGLMETSFHRADQRVLSSGVTYGLVGEAEAVVAARQWSLMYCNCGGSGDFDNDDYSG